jgi:hypothetical protein
MFRSLFAVFGLKVGFAVSMNYPNLLLKKLLDGWKTFFIGSISDLSKSYDPR